MVCPPPWWCWVQGVCAVPCFCSWHSVYAPGSSKLSVGFFGLSEFWGSRIWSNCTCMQLFLVLYIYIYIYIYIFFFAFCCSRRGVSRCKHCSTTAKGSRSQAYLLFLLADQEGDRSQSGGDTEIRTWDGTKAAVVQGRSSTEDLLITRGLQLSVLQDFWV